MRFVSKYVAVLAVPVRHVPQSQGRAWQQPSKLSMFFATCVLASCSLQATAEHNTQSDGICLDSGFCQRHRASSIGRVSLARRCVSSGFVSGQEMDEKDSASLPGKH